MEAPSVFLSAVLSERQKSWNKAEANYEEVLRLIYKTKWRKHLNKEKLRLLDECQAGCITGRVLHLHVPTLARMACCHIHTGDLNDALSSIDKAILLDFRNPLSPTQVCEWLLRGLLKKIKKEETELRFSKQECDLEKACAVSPDAIMFVNIKDVRSHFQALFDRFLPSVRVSHSISVHDVIDAEMASKPWSAKERVQSAQTLSLHTVFTEIPSLTREKTTAPPSSKFLSGVAKPQRRIRTCPPQHEEHSKKKLERFYIDPSISHHKCSLNTNGQVPQRVTTHVTLSRITCDSRDQRVTLRDVVNVRSACVCNNSRIIGIQNFRKRDEDLEPNEDLPHASERMYSRKWLQDRIPTEIPDYAGCRKL